MITIDYVSFGVACGTYTNVLNNSFDFRAYPNEDGGWEYEHIDTDITEQDFYQLHDELLATQPKLNSTLLEAAE
jgi:hypothetical protein